MSTDLSNLSRPAPGAPAVPTATVSDANTIGTFEQAAARASQQLATDDGAVALASPDPASALLQLVRSEWSVLGRYEDRAGPGLDVAPYEVLILGYSRRSDVAALLIYVDDNDGITAPARWATAPHGNRKAALSRAFSTACAGDSLLGLLTKLQRQSLVWPARDGHSFPNLYLNAPRLGACRAVLSMEGEDIDCLKLLVGLGGFVGLNESGEHEELLTRLRWHRANESVLRHTDPLRRRYVAWRDSHGLSNPTGERPELIGARTHVFGQVVARRLATNASAPLDPEGLIDRSFVLAQADTCLVESTQRLRPREQTLQR